MSRRTGAVRVAVVVSRYNATITGPMLEGARAAFEAAGHDPGALAVVQAPGSFELPALALAAARTRRFDGVLAIGCIIKGETEHDRYIAQAVASGLVDVTVATGVPVAFGVLTVETVEQARERAGGVHGNKGEQAMQALLSTIDQIRSLAQAAPRTVSAPMRYVPPDKAADTSRARRTRKTR
jgi:6,7-dimethyl-8-ribityllumazine synthase